jgi:hypothetical protein
MTIDEAFYAKVIATAGLTAIIGTRCYPKFVPQHASYPCIVFDSDLEQRGRSNAGVNKLNRAAIHVTCWAATETAAQALGAALVTAHKDTYKTTWGTVKVSKADIEQDAGDADEIIGDDGLLKFGRLYEITVWFVEQ